MLKSHLQLCLRGSCISFKSIDPTPCYASAHPKEQGSTIAFSVRDTESETPNDIDVSEITTRHLRRLKNSAIDFLGKEVNAAVMTVPTNFTDAQKSSLNDAAKAAGLDILQFIHEPIAAVLAYDAQPEAKLSDKIVVVADLGGIRSDVAVIASRGGMYSILATAHDYEYSGSALDGVLMDYIAKEFMKKHKTDPRENDRSLAKLKLEAEDVKKALSLGASASFSVESLANGIDFSMSINRTRFELLGSKVFSGFIRLISQLVEKAELDVLDVDEIILSGGSSHTPKIAQGLKAVFPPSTNILAPTVSPSALNPSELAVRGAAIQASLAQEFDMEDIEQNTHPMVTVTPHLSKAIGVLCISTDESQGVFHALIPADTPVPVRRTAQIATPKSGGDVLIRLCEGSRKIKVTKPQPKPTTNGDAKEKTTKDDDDSDEDDSEEEEDEVREKVWIAEKTLAEAAITGVKKGGKVEVQVNVGLDLSMQLVLREVGGQGGVRGSIAAAGQAENGSV